MGHRGGSLNLSGGEKIMLEGRHGLGEENSLYDLSSNVRCGDTPQARHLCFVPVPAEHSMYQFPPNQHHPL